MNRRKFVISAAGAAIGGSVLVGSGAFTSVEADRQVEINVADDSDAFLAFERAREEYIGEAEDGRLVISLGEPTTDEGGEGFNDRGLTRVDDIVNIVNQGTQPAAVGFLEEGDDELNDESQSTTVPLENPDEATAEVTLTLSSDAEEIETGGGATISVDVDTRAEPDDTAETGSVTLSGSSEADVDYDEDENGSGIGGG